MSLIIWWSRNRAKLEASVTKCGLHKTIALILLRYPFCVDCNNGDASLFSLFSSNPFSLFPTHNTPMAATFSNPTSPFAPALPPNYHPTPARSSLAFCSSFPTSNHHSQSKLRRFYRSSPSQYYNCRIITCKATEVSVAEGSSAPGGDERWVPVVPLSALPKGERRVIIQDGETILLLWFKDQVFAIENRSPAEGAYSEGLINAKLTQDGCIVCPSTDSTFDLQTGEIKEWYPKNPVLRTLTPPLRTLFTYPAKTDEQNIYISMGVVKTDAEAEIVFSGKAQPGITASDVNVEEVRMVIDDDLEGFGFTGKNEIINGKAAAIGFLLLLDFELLTGKGLLKGTGFLDFIYSISNALK